MTKSLNELRDEIHEIAKSKGWHDDVERDENGKPTARQMLAWIALVTDELDEADIEHRAEYISETGKPEGYLVEVVDARIRAFDIAGACGFDLPDDLLAFLEDVSCVEQARSKLVSSVRNGGDDIKERFIAFTASIEMKFQDLYDDHENESCQKAMDRLTSAKCAYNRTRPRRHGGKLA